MTAGSPVGGAGQLTPEDAGLSGVRERLIEAGVTVLRDGRIGTDDAGIVFPDEARVVAEDLLAAVLRLIADEIEAHKMPTYTGLASEGYDLGIGDAAALVRSWAADGAR